jgi:hypothetical protein
MDRFQNLPGVIGNCTRLVTLELNGNRLNGLPATIGKLLELEIVFLRNNPISEFPEEITDLKKIENIDMYGLPFCEPSPNIRNWPDLVNEDWEGQISASLAPVFERRWAEPGFCPCLGSDAGRKSAYEGRTPGRRDSGSGRVRNAIASPAIKPGLDFTAGRSLADIVLSPGAAEFGRAKPSTGPGAIQPRAG